MLSNIILLSVAPHHRALPQGANALCCAVKFCQCCVSLLHVLCLYFSLVEYIAQYKADIYGISPDVEHRLFYIHTQLYVQTDVQEKKYANSIQIYLCLSHLI